VTLLRSANAGAAIVPPANPNLQPTYNLPAGLERLVEKNPDFLIYPDPDSENENPPALPSESPVEPQISDTTASAAEVAPNVTTPADETMADTDEAPFETGEEIPTPVAPTAEATAETGDANPSVTASNDVPNETNSGASDTNDNTSLDANDSTPENFSDYYKFKFGHAGNYYGGNADADPNPPQSTDSGMKTDEATNSEEVTKTEETAVGNEAGDNEEAANAADPVNAAEETARTDETPKSDASPSDSTSGQAKTEILPNADPPTSSSIQDYYHYLYEPIDGQYGNNQNPSTKDNTSLADNGSVNRPNSDDDEENTATDSDDEVSENDSSGIAASPMAGAMLALVSRWADVYASNFGLNLSQVENLLEWMK